MEETPGARPSVGTGICALREACDDGLDGQYAIHRPFNERMGT